MQGLALAKKQGKNRRAEFRLSGHEAKLVIGGDFAWVTHGLLHTCQLVELQWAYTIKRAESYRVKYTGIW